MTAMDAESPTAIDFAVAAYREDGTWQLSPLPPRAATSLEVLVHALQQLPGEVGTPGMVSAERLGFGAEFEDLVDTVTA